MSAEIICVSEATLTNGTVMRKHAVVRATLVTLERGAQAVCCWTLRTLVGFAGVTDAAMEAKGTGSCLKQYGGETEKLCLTGKKIPFCYKGRCSHIHMYLLQQIFLCFQCIITPWK